MSDSRSRDTVPFPSPVRVIKRISKSNKSDNQNKSFAAFTLVIDS